MEFLGHSLKVISKSLNYKNSNPIDLYYENVEQFCDATSKVIRGFKDSCRFIVTDSKENRHIIEVLDYRYDSKQNLITLYPESCKRISDSKKYKNKTTNK